MKFLPQRAPIEAFGGGGFRFAGMSHQGSLLVLPSGMRAWRPGLWSDVALEDFAGVVEELGEIDMLLLGTGVEMVPVSKLVAAHLTGAGVRFDAMSTSAAIHTYNVVLAEDRRVAAAFIAVEKAHARR